MVAAAKLTSAWPRLRNCREPALDESVTRKIAQRLSSDRGWSEPVFIDAGASAAVYKMEIPEKGSAALKIYDPRFFSEENAVIEARRCELQAGLRDHGHPNLINILEVDELAHEGTWYLIMEFCPWPSLAKQLAQVPDTAVHTLIRQLTEAVLFLSEKGFVHRDIKPANIVVSEDYSQLKLLDLGVLRKVAPEEGSGTDGDEKRRFIATAQYSPPEFLTRDEAPGAAGYDAINIYQIGAVLHDLIMKEPIFAAEAATGNKYILFKAVTARVPRVRSTTLPVRLCSISSCALEKDPIVRLEKVQLNDFLADADDPATIRRRLAAGQSQGRRPPPSLVVWEPRVRSWIGRACRLEATALGAHTIRSQHPRGLLLWRVTFENVDAAALVSVSQVDDAPNLNIISESDPPIESTLLQISDVPDMEEAEIVPALAQHLLYALSLAAAPRFASDDCGAPM